MDTARVRAILQDVAAGASSLEAALEALAAEQAAAGVENLGFARIDHHRRDRQGFPEVVFGLGKSPAQVAEIAERIVARRHNLLVTRATPEAFAAVAARLPDAEFRTDARIICCVRQPPEPGRGTILVACAGTSDLPVAEEAAVTAELMGNRVDRVFDVGVAGLHRLLSEHERLRAADVIIVVAGMEGALPSVVGGLVRVPVIAVPTSVGYGASFGGIAALLGMLNSCATGVAVVNIDNGFGAGALASRINHLGVARA
ncbi:MAG: nickel pincer cofactor biosynthesis protein LarB [Vicinamibacterales bacterium]